MDRAEALKKLEEEIDQIIEDGRRKRTKDQPNDQAPTDQEEPDK